MSNYQDYLKLLRDAAKDAKKIIIVDYDLPEDVEEELKKNMFGVEHYPEACPPFTYIWIDTEVSDIPQEHYDLKQIFFDAMDKEIDFRIERAKEYGNKSTSISKGSIGERTYQRLTKEGYQISVLGKELGKNYGYTIKLK